ncbi:MAG: hypothetical protein PHE25_01810, partial [Candidatus Gracilibacteria bacterium]|nr:hypothetical protein [Candidatus Gracilibacteria bacterium]
MKDGSIFNKSLNDKFKDYLKTLNQDEINKLISGVFGPAIDYDELKSIKITDVTLREGDQAPLTSFNKDEKKLIYLLLRELGVHTIEVGFPAGATDFENVKELVDFFSDDKNPPFISVLGRTLELDTTKSLEAVKNAKNIRVHTFIATSQADILGKFCKDGKSLEEGKEFVKASIKNQVSILKQA